jgi:hypothetical protein
MRITKCDICRKTIEKDSRSIYVGLGSIFNNSFEICENCGKPVLKLLKDKKLIKVENKKDGRKK